MVSQSHSNNIKTYILYATISLMLAGGIIAIFMIFFGLNLTLLKTISTLLILYLTAFLSIRNIPRIESPEVATRFCSIASLIANLFWAIPWILLVWGCFGDSVYLLDIIWRLVWTMLAISIYFSAISVQVPYYKQFHGLILAQRGVSFVLLSFLFLDVLVFIWVNSYSAGLELLTKTFLAELIIILLQWAISNILIRSKYKQQTNTPPTPPQNPQTDNSQQSSQGVITPVDSDKNL